MHLRGYARVAFSSAHSVAPLIDTCWICSLLVLPASSEGGADLCASKPGTLMG